MSAAPQQPVDLVVNVFERTYRRALQADVFERIVQAHGRPFARRVALVNNVEDRDDAHRLAQRLLADGAIDEAHFVADHLPRALGAAELSRAQLEPLLHYSDGPLVAASLPGSPWFLYWDPEARLAEPGDWITPALELMSADAHVMVANPSWEAPDEHGKRHGVEREAIETRAGFALGHGFSDQVFLAARSSLAAPIYRQRCIASIAYPGAHKAKVFEARVAAHMRHNDRLRATFLGASYLTDSAGGTSSYPPRGATETLRYVRNGLLLRAARVSPWRPRCLLHTWV